MRKISLSLTDAQAASLLQAVEQPDQHYGPGYSHQSATRKMLEAKVRVALEVEEHPND